MPAPLAIIDAFTAVPFAGNPAAVCLPDRPCDDAWCQALARELNLPATAFVTPAADAHDLRWFSPTTELALCGHGTLAAAHFLWTSGQADPDAPIRFRTAAGPLACRREGPWIAMDFPAEPAAPVADPPPALFAALGIAPVPAFRNRLDYLLDLPDPATVDAIRPDLPLLRTIATRGVIVTTPAPATADHDFVSRFFAPGAGIDEDPATGSAHCALGPHWGQRLAKTDLIGHQRSPRGGTIRVRLHDTRLDLLGQATTILHGTTAT